MTARRRRCRRASSVMPFAGTPFCACWTSTAGREAVAREARLGPGGGLLRVAVRTRAVRAPSPRVERDAQDAGGGRAVLDGATRGSAATAATSTAATIHAPVERRAGGQRGEPSATPAPMRENRGHERMRTQLAAGAVLLDGHAQPHRAEHAAAHVEVPALEVAAGEDHSADAAQRLLDAAHALVGRAPALAPDAASCGGSAGPGGEPSGAATATGRGAGARRAGRRAGACRARPVRRRMRQRAEPRAAGGATLAVRAAERGLEDECRDGRDQQRQRQQQRRPQQAERERPRQAARSPGTTRASAAASRGSPGARW